MTDEFTHIPRIPSLRFTLCEKVANYLWLKPNHKKHMIFFMHLYSDHNNNNNNNVF